MNFKEYLDPYDNYKLCLINPSDAAHWMIEVPEKADFLLQWQANHPTFYRNKYGERYNRSYKQWDLVDGDEGIKEMICLWSREPTLEQGLISGADALRALADGKEIQWVSADFKNWNDLDIWNANLKTFLNEKYIAEGEFKFRLKPSTIKIELEIPAPFEPKKGDEFYHIWPESKDGWGLCNFSNGYEHHAQLGAWRTEEEIKQVVAALRGGIKG
ncbi:hypothetical protein [Acinetobacter junii]|uniref:hypothetical protein n=1 Tax=Acinetobacter junii TaxID=40215 RepID=UPI00301A50BA